MKRALCIITVATMWLITPGRGLEQQQTPPQAMSQSQRAAHQPVQASRTPYQRRDTWYEFLLKQFNPDKLNYGAWMEQHRHAFLDASVRNPYFGYSAGLTIALLIVTIVYAKQRIDHRRAMWITAAMMADLYNHDTYSRQLARDAIQKYNDHIERCNRAVEAAERKPDLAGTDSDSDSLRSELQSVTGERDSCKRERDLAKQELSEKERLLTDMSLRLDALAKRSGANRDASAADARTADPKLVQHINSLQEQLYAERRENKRLKGA